jgi:hypothetical protein
LLARAFCRPLLIPSLSQQLSASAPTSSSWLGGASGAIKVVLSSHAGWDNTSAKGGDGSACQSAVERTPMTFQEALNTPVVPMFDIASLAMLNHSNQSINRIKQLSIVDFSDSSLRQHKTKGQGVEKRKGACTHRLFILFVAHLEPQLVLEAGGSGRG